jgi:hypothetical protein
LRLKHYSNSKNQISRPKTPAMMFSGTLEACVAHARQAASKAEAHDGAKNHNDNNTGGNHNQRLAPNATNAVAGRDPDSNYQGGNVDRTSANVNENIGVAVPRAQEINANRAPTFSTSTDTGMGLSGGSNSGAGIGAGTGAGIGAGITGAGITGGTGSAEIGAGTNRPGSAGNTRPAILPVPRAGAFIEVRGPHGAGKSAILARYVARAAVAASSGS